VLGHDSAVGSPATSCDDHGDLRWGAESLCAGVRGIVAPDLLGFRPQRQPAQPGLSSPRDKALTPDEPHSVHLDQVMTSVMQSNAAFVSVRCPKRSVASGSTPPPLCARPQPGRDDGPGVSWTGEAGTDPAVRFWRVISSVHDAPTNAIPVPLSSVLAPKGALRMQRRQLGRTGPQVSAMGLGCSRTVSADRPEGGLRACYIGEQAT